MLKRFSFVIFVVATLVVDACSSSPQPAAPEEQLPPPRELSELSVQEKSAIQSINKFGWKLFQSIYSTTDADDNIFFSPLSVSYALGLALNGARGATLDSIKSAMELHYLSVEEINLAFREITRMLTAADTTVVFKSANSIWHRNSKSIKPSFLETCRKYFFATVRGVDFRDPSTPGLINNWVSDNTAGKITEIVKAPMNPDIASIIFNAIYFKATWALEFDPARTGTWQFHLANGDSTTCQLMYRNSDEDMQLFPEVSRQNPIGQFHSGDIVGANLPYGNHGFVMTLILPDTVTTLDAIFPAIDEGKIVSWGKINSARDCGYNILLPRLKFSWATGLKDPLKALGMANAFSESADFGGMFADGVGWFSEARQNSFVQIDEKGTEAAAVTRLVYSDCLKTEVTCNRPFLFVIQERVSGAIIFIGKIGKPVWAE